MYATEQERPDVLKKREEWSDGQIGLNPDKLIFIDESVLQTAEELSLNFGDGVAGQAAAVMG